MLSLVNVMECKGVGSSWSKVLSYLSEGKGGASVVQKREVDI